MNLLPRLAQSLLNRPLMLHPLKAELIVAALAERLGVASMTRISGETIKPSAMWDDDDVGEFTQSGGTPDHGYDVVAGVAVIPVCGTLVKTLGTVRPYSGMQGYDSIRGALLCASEDPEVRAIVLDTDSPGGEVAGCFDLVDEIYRMRGQKPIWAILNESAYSAAYAIASAADRVIVPRTGGTGSIGIVAMHVDFSRALSGSGLAVTFIQYGARKTDGAGEKPLSDQALSNFQKDIDILGDLFVDTVARNRGISASVVRGTEAGTFLAQAGVDLGLADSVMAPEAAFAELVASLV